MCFKKLFKSSKKEKTAYSKYMDESKNKPERDKNNVKDTSNEFKNDDVIYISLCCKTKICSKCLLTWHLINNSYICPNCGKNNKNIFDYEYTYYGT